MPRIGAARQGQRVSRWMMAIVAIANRNMQQRDEDRGQKRVSGGAFGMLSVFEIFGRRVVGYGRLPS